MAPVDIVFFHSGAPNAHVLRPLVGATDYPALVEGAIWMARNRAPDARVVVVTDSPDILADRTDGVRVEVVAIEARQLMLERLRAYARFVADRIGTTDAAGALFLDTDIAVMRPVDALFAEAFDIALTHSLGADDLRKGVRTCHRGVHRDRPRSPVNGGVIAARYTAAAASFLAAAVARLEAFAAEGEAFLEAARNRYRGRRRDGTTVELHVDDVRRWGGDQFALVSLISDAFFAGFPDRFEAAGATIRMLPSDPFNYTPRTGDDEVSLSARHLVHFKGSRKTEMLRFLSLLRDRIDATPA